MIDPFDGWPDTDDSEKNEELERQLQAVLALDSLEEDVTSWEAEWLENVLRRLRDEKRCLSEKQLTILRRMCEQYDVEF